MPPSRTLLILWDIDHTLIDTGGVGTEVYATAFEKVIGRPMEQMADVSGRTEPVIFRETLALHGLDYTAALYDQFAAEQARGYADRIAELRTRGRALPGAADALAALAGREDAFQTVLTGNTRDSARIKLSAFGLASYLDLDAAAYGTDDDERPALVPVAQQRATMATGVPFAAETTVLIGDTPNDVEAALRNSAQIVAVATGDFSSADLASAGAMTVLADLTRPYALLAALYPPEPSE